MTKLGFLDNTYPALNRTLWLFSLKDKMCFFLQSVCYFTQTKHSYEIMCEEREKGYNWGHDGWVWNQVRLQMTSGVFCADGNVATVIGNKRRALTVGWLLDRKLAGHQNLHVRVLIVSPNTQIFGGLVALLQIIYPTLLNEDWSLWQGSQPALNMTELPRHQANRVILFGMGT